MIQANRQNPSKRMILEKIAKVCETHSLNPDFEVFCLDTAKAVDYAESDLSRDGRASIKTLMYEVTLVSGDNNEIYVTGISLPRAYQGIESIAERFPNFSQELLKDLLKAGIRSQE